MEIGKPTFSFLSRLSEILLHPEYNATTSWSFDIALIKLSAPADERFHWPACLPSQNADYSGQMGWMYGRVFPQKKTSLLFFSLGRIIAGSVGARRRLFASRGLDQRQRWDVQVHRGDALRWGNFQRTSLLGNVDRFGPIRVMANTLNFTLGRTRWPSDGGSGRSSHRGWSLQLGSWLWPGWKTVCRVC